MADTMGNSKVDKAVSASGMLHEYARPVDPELEEGWWARAAESKLAHLATPEREAGEEPARERER